jgi:hypothetical protein
MRISYPSHVLFAVNAFPLQKTLLQVWQKQEVRAGSDRKIRIILQVKGNAHARFRYYVLILYGVFLFVVAEGE